MSLLIDSCNEAVQLGQDGKKWIIKGPMGVLDKKNENNRVYTTEFWGSVLKKPQVKEGLEKRRFLGEMGHPSSVFSTMERASHVLTKLVPDASTGLLMGEAEILDTPSGKILKILCNHKIGFGASTRGAQKSPSVKIKEVDYPEASAYVFGGIDFVLNPAAGTYPELVKEHTEEIKLALKDDVEKIEQERDFYVGLLTEAVVDGILEKQDYPYAEMSQEVFTDAVRPLEVTLEDSGIGIKKVEVRVRDLYTQLKQKVVIIKKLESQIEELEADVQVYREAALLLHRSVEHMAKNDKDGYHEASLLLRQQLEEHDKRAFVEGVPVQCSCCIVKGVLLKDSVCPECGSIFVLLSAQVESLTVELEKKQELADELAQANQKIKDFSKEVSSLKQNLESGDLSDEVMRLEEELVDAKKAYKRIKTQFLSVEALYAKEQVAVKAYEAGVEPDSVFDIIVDDFSPKAIEKAITLVRREARSHTMGREIQGLQVVTESSKPGNDMGFVKNAVKRI